MSLRSKSSLDSELPKGKNGSKKKKSDSPSLGSRILKFFGGRKKKKLEKAADDGGSPMSGESSFQKHTSEDDSLSLLARLPDDGAIFSAEFQADKAKEYEAYLKMISPEERKRVKEVPGVIYHGGRPYGSDVRDKVGHNVGVKGLDGQWHLEEPDLEFDDRIAGEMYGQHEGYQRVRQLQHQLCSLRHRNVTITCQLRLMEHQNKVSLQQIEDLGRHNRRLIADNTAYIAQALENQVLEQDVVSYQNMLTKIQATMTLEDARNYAMMRDSQRCKDQRRHLLEDLQRFELTSVASGLKVDLLQQKERLMEACKVDHHVRRIMADQIQALEGSIRVFLRVRGSQGAKRKTFLQLRSEDSVSVPVTVSGRQENRVFNFNAVFPASTTQTELFEGMKHLTGEFLDGKSLCIFSYGASGSGKSYSLLGPDTSTDRGLCTRLVEDLLRRTIADKRRSYNLSLSILEFHNDQLLCLLSGRRCRLRGQGHLVAVEGHTSVPLISSFRLQELLEEAVANRQSCTVTPNNAAPWRRSLSDLAVVIKLSSKYAYFEEEEEENKESGKKEEKEEAVFTLVDLTGFTAKNNGNNPSSRHRSGGRTLAALDHVIEAIRSEAANVPYRRNLLTHFLRPCFEGGAVCCALLTAKDGDAGDRKATLRTLEFGRRLMDTRLGNAPPIKSQLVPIMDTIYES